MLLRLVPNDVQQLVYRLLFDYNYHKLIDEYQRRWLDMNDHWMNDQTYWVADDYFANEHRGVANYRYLESIPQFMPYLIPNFRWHIVKFNNVCAFVPIETSIRLPKRYLYSGFTAQSTTDRVQVAIIGMWNYYTGKLMDIFE